MTPLGFFDRIGGILAAPRRTLMRLAAGEARPSDLGWLLALRIGCGELDRLVRALLLIRAEGLLAGVQAALAVTTVVLPDVAGLLLAGLLLGLFVPRGARGYGRAFDLAAYAWVPYLAVSVAKALFYTARGLPPAADVELMVDAVGVGWGALVWGMALDAARRPAEAST